MKADNVLRIKNIANVTHTIDLFDIGNRGSQAVKHENGSRVICP